MTIKILKRSGIAESVKKCDKFAEAQWSIQMKKEETKFNSS
jgi:hypothetical protein